MRARPLILLSLLLPGCAALGGALGGDPSPWAGQVTIERDEWGVPHIAGTTDAAVVYGIAQAQAEDNFWQVEENLLRAIGRAANLYGATALADDIVKAAFEVQRLAREEYEREPPHRRLLWDAYAAGLNDYLSAHPEVRPRLLWHVEPWYVFAMMRDVDAATIVDGVRVGSIVTLTDSLPAGSGLPDTAAAVPGGSNLWAVAPDRTTAGNALLFINPHVSFFGATQRYEMHLRSDEGWHFTGISLLGVPVPRAGHNEHLAWGHAESLSDTRDAFIIRFDHPSDSLAYRWGGEWRRAEPFTATIAVNTTTGVEQRTFRFLRTHHGPIVARQEDGSHVAVRIARMQEGGALQQWYEMGRSATLEAFRTALAHTAIPGVNTMYADTAGNIYYVHGNAVPKRLAGADPSRLLDGSDPRNDWNGYHALGELPALLNPGSGWLQNTNGTPFLATAIGYNLDRESYPPYMAPESDNARARRSRELLAGNSAWTFEAWQSAAFDAYVTDAETWIPRLIDEYERRGAVDAAGVLPLDEPIALLRAWNRISSVDSPEMTLFVTWMEIVRRTAGQGGTWPLTSALDRALARLSHDWDSTAVPWGVVNRLQRIHSSGLAPFDSAAASLPIAGAPTWTGTIFNFETRPGPEGARRYGVSGHSWVGAVELAPRIDARTVVPFGQSADPASPHHFDQAALYAESRFKEVGFWRTWSARTTEAAN